MTDRPGERAIESSSTTPGLPISPSLGGALHETRIRKHAQSVSPRTLAISALAAGLAVVATGVAYLLVQLIYGVTQLAFFGRLSLEPGSPADNALGAWVILVPVAGAFVVGLMARYGSSAIRGHGIPEAMEQILTNESRIPPRVTLLKPSSAAIAIGTGGPFGAEGPIIATGGSMGSVLGQILEVSAEERKVLLAAGAAAGMTAIFGSPVSAILLAIELLLFEYRPRSFVPVAIAVVVAMSVRVVFFGSSPIFPIEPLPYAGGEAIALYGVEGLILGVFAVFVTKLVYWIEDQFERLPIHWMWWPMLGGLAVGLIGWRWPHTLGVGYENIERLLNGEFAGTALAVFALMKLASWAVALGSGTSGGTLAPLLTVGGAIGVLVSTAANWAFSGPVMDVRVSALVGMAACFAGASRALFASIVFAFEVTRQPNGLVPLLIGCTVAYVVSALSMRTTIMTEKLARRGQHVPHEYSAV